MRLLLEIQEATRDLPAAFLAAFDRFVCWREMADNFCLYNPNYDKILAAPKWAKDTLNLHQVSERIRTGGRPWARFGSLWLAVWRL